MAEATPNQIRAEQLVEALWRDSELGAKVRTAAKAKFGDHIRIPEDDVEPLLATERAERAKLQKQYEELAAWRAEREAKEAEAATFEKLRGGVDKAVREYSLTDEGRAKMLDRMKETGNLSDPDAAAAWVVSKTPPAPVVGPSWAPQNLDLKNNIFGTRDDERLKALHRDPGKYLDAELVLWQRDPEGYAKEAFGQ